MGIKNIQRSELLKNAPEHERIVLDLFPGGQNELWDSLINVRMQFDGNYRHIRPRGGIIEKQSFFGQILSIYGFSTSVDNVQVDYVAVHTATGAVFLLEKDVHLNPDTPPTPVTIFPATTFNTSEQVTIFHIGKFIYVFDFKDEVYKYYDIENEESFDWLANQSTSISSWVWRQGSGEDWREENVFGIAEGREVIVIHNFLEGAHLDPSTNRLSFQSFRTKIDTVSSDAITYLDPAGVPYSTATSPETGMIGASPDLSDYEGYESKFLSSGNKLRGSFQVLGAPANQKIILQVGDIRVPAVGAITAEGSDTATEVAIEIYDALLSSTEVTSLWSVTRDGVQVFLERDSEGDQRPNVEFSVRNIEGEINFVDASSPRTSQTPFGNEFYRDPIAYRGYLVVDLLSDGSYAIPGRPISVQTSLPRIISAKRTAVNITVPAAKPNVAKRFLFSTRWQTEAEKAFNPTSPEYPNNAFFLSRQIRLGAGVVSDTTPDRKLLTGLSAFIRMAAGAIQFFGKGQLTPKSSATIENVLLLGGYDINRPVPLPYTTAANPTEGNAYIDMATGDNLTDDPKVALMFEYTDGKRSEIVDTAEVLTDGERIINPGVSATQATVEFTCTADASGTGAVEFRLMSDYFALVELNYLADDTKEMIVQKLVIQINNFSSLSDRISASVAGAGDVLRITWDTPGADGNDETIRVWYSATTQFDNESGPGAINKSLTGGTEGTVGVTLPGNVVQIHSLNALVAKVFVLVFYTGTPNTYKLMREVEITSAFFHGAEIYLPNTVAPLDAAPTFTPSASSEVRTTASLPDYIVAAIPFNQPLINEQARIKDNSPIAQLVPTQFDFDKNQMRFRIMVFTSRNVQIGYIILGGTTVTYDFEVIGQGVALTHKYGARLIEGSVIYQADDGIYSYSQQGAAKIVDRYQYDVLENNLQSVVYNRFHKEYWMLFSDNEALIISPDGQVRKRFIFPSSLGPTRQATYSGNKLVLSIGQRLFFADVDGADDNGDPIVGELITTHIGDPRTQAKILEVAVAGQDLDVDVALDLQLPRLERTSTPWSKDFQEDVATTPEPAFMHGTPFPFTNRAVMPKVRIKTTGENDGFISHISLTHQILENKGKAR